MVSRWWLTWDIFNVSSCIYKNSIAIVTHVQSVQHSAGLVSWCITWLPSTPLYHGRIYAWGCAWDDLRMILTLKVSRDRANRFVCVAFFSQFKLSLPHIEHRANCNHHQIFWSSGWYMSLKSLFLVFRQFPRFHKKCWMVLSSISTSTDAEIQSYPLE